MRPEIPKHRFRITVRGNNAELRGRATLTLDRLNDLARSIQAFGWMVVASPLGEGDLDFVEQSDKIRAAAEAVVRHYDQLKGTDNTTSPELRVAIEQLGIAVGK